MTVPRALLAALCLMTAACATAPGGVNDSSWARPGERVRWAPGATRVMQVGDTTCRANAAPGVRQRIVSAAASQWKAFGYPVLDRTANSATLIPSDGGAPIVAGPLNPTLPPESRTRAALRLGLMEDDPNVARAIGAYWAVTDPDQIATQNRLWAIAPSAGWAVAWSAAFVSWVMCEAGVSEEEFRRSPAHLTYIEQARQSPRAFRYEANGDGVINPGDLICALRGSAEASDLFANTTYVGTHCDIVVKIDLARQRIYAIGGNVVQAVTMTIVGYTSEDGRMRMEAPPEHPGAPRWVAVLRLNMPDAGPADLETALIG